MGEPNRKSPRMKGFDYSMPTAYFITICTYEKACLFGSPSHLNRWGQTAHDLLVDLPNHMPSLKIERFAVMPNHVHMLILLKESAATISISEVVARYKAAVSREIHRSNPDVTVWQRSFHDHVVRTQDAWERIWKYIEENPYMSGLLLPMLSVERQRAGYIPPPQVKLPPQGRDVSRPPFLSNPLRRNIHALCPSPPSQ